MLSASALNGEAQANMATVFETPRTLAEQIAARERHIILEVLAANGGRIAETAAQLGVSRKNLWEKMRKLNIQLTASHG